jgi:hypothetical protein
MLLRALLVGAGLLVSGCADHDPELGRVGDPLPEIERQPDPDIPCEQDDIMRRKCRRCHSNPPKNNAPFPLMTWGDVQADYGEDRLRHQRMYEMIESRVMPLVELPLDPPVEPLTDGEYDSMLDWLDQGAPGVIRGACDGADASTE